MLGNIALVAGMVVGLAAIFISWDAYACGKESYRIWRASDEQAPAGVMWGWALAAAPWLPVFWRLRRNHTHLAAAEAWRYALRMNVAGAISFASIGLALWVKNA